jgi:hypothetical protein
MNGKAKRVEQANQDRAEAAVRWEESDHRAQESGRASDAAEAARDDRALTDADRRIRKAQAGP